MARCSNVYPKSVVLSNCAVLFENTLKVEIFAVNCLLALYPCLPTIMKNLFKLTLNLSFNGIQMELCLEQFAFKKGRFIWVALLCMLPLELGGNRGETL